MGSKKQPGWGGVVRPPAWLGCETSGEAGTQVGGPEQIDGNQHCMVLCGTSAAGDTLASPLVSPTGLHVMMCPPLSCRVTAGYTSIRFGRHTNGWRCRAFRNGPVFVGIKVVQYQGSSGIPWDLLHSRHGTWEGNYVLWKMHPQTLLWDWIYSRAIWGTRVHTRLCASSRHTVHTHALCLLDIITHVNSALDNIEVGNYELLFINELWSFLLFTLPNTFALTKYSPVDNSCSNRGELAWPYCCPSGGRWLSFQSNRCASHSPRKSTFVCPYVRQINCHFLLDGERAGSC